MNYLKIKNGTPEAYTIRQLRQDNPQTSFPRDISLEVLAEYGVYPYTRSDAPEYDYLTARLVDGSLEQDSDGNWSLPYIVEQLPLDQASVNIRSKRDGLLQETDWMALSDNTMTEVWASYRQALRDISDQADFPYSVIWPVKPE